MTSRIEKEKEFHNVTFSEQTRTATDKFYSITESSAKMYHDLINRFGEGKTVLEYGCGADSNAMGLAQRGAKITGIDISEVAIEESRKLAAEEGVSDASFHVMNAEELEFEPNSFDVICGSAILHHLILNRAYAEVARTLREDGVAVFLEPLGHNPAINLYRKLTPSMRTDDEHPLLRSDLELAKAFFTEIEVTYFHLSSLGSIPLAGLPFFPKLVSSLDSVDQLLFKLAPVFQRYAWTCVMVLRQPNKSLFR